MPLLPLAGATAEPAGGSVPSCRQRQRWVRFNVPLTAEKHKVIERPPAPQNGGVFVVPKDLPEEIEAQIFDDAGYAEQRQSSIVPIMFALLKVISFDRLKRCFNGGK